MNNQKIYTRDQLPKELHLLTTPLGYITKTEIEKTLTEISIDLFVIRQMKNKANDLTIIDGYRFGKTKGFSSLLNICNEYLNGIEKHTNEIYIKDMHNAAAPFFTEILNYHEINCKEQAKQLIKAHTFAKNVFLNEIG